MSESDDRERDEAAVLVYAQKGTSLLNELHQGSLLRAVAEPIISCVAKDAGTRIRSTSQLPYLSLKLCRYSDPSEFDGAPALHKLELALDAVHERAQQAGPTAEVERLLLDLTHATVGTSSVRQAVSALSEVVVLGSLVRQYDGTVDLWPELPGGRKSDCILRHGIPEVNIEVGAAWTDEDTEPIPDCTHMLYRRDNLLAERLVGTLREKRGQMRRCYTNVLFWCRMIVWDEQNDRLNARGNWQQFERRLGDELRRKAWHGLSLVIAEMDSLPRLERIYDVYNTARDDASRQRLVSDIEGAFRAHWYVADKYEVRTIRV